MMSEWRVTSNLIAGEMLYSCYRLKDVNAVDHSGNREELGRWFGTKEAAQVVADQMNKGEIS